MKRSDLHKGFSVVEIVLVGAVVVLAGTVGYLLYRNISSDKNDSTTAKSEQDSANSKPVDLTAEKAAALYNSAMAANYTASNVGKDFKIQQSKTAGYRTADVYMQETSSQTSWVTLYYQVPDGTWRFFTSTQSKLLCSKYDTIDLKKAYEGQPCYTDDYNDSTVAVN